MMAESPKVEVPQGAFIGLIVTLLVTLLALTFILGRMSANPPPPPPQASPTADLSVSVSGQTTSGSEHGSSSGVLITSSRPRPRPSASAQPPDPTPAAPETPSMPPVSQVPTRVVTHRETAVTPSPVADDRETVHIASGGHPIPPGKDPAPPRGHNAEVVNYLKQVDSLTAGAGDLGDPNEFATKMLGQAAQGDTSGFDDLLGKLKKAKAQLASIHPPAACKEHYHLTQVQMQNSQALLEALKKSMVTMDTSSLTTLAAKGQTMQAEAKKLEALTAQLKARYQ